MARVLRLNQVHGEGQGVPVVVLRADLWKGNWQARAEDGTEVAFDLAEKIAHGALVSGEGRLFTIEQKPEDTIVIMMPEDANMAMKIGWYLGNRHLPIEVREGMVLLEFFPSLAESLERIGIAYELRVEVLQCAPHSEHTH